MPDVDERAVLAARLRIILERFAEQIAEFPPGRLEERAILTGNGANVIVAHVLGSVRGWVLGIGCGVDITRDRVSEFAASGATAEALIADIRTLADEAQAALLALPPGRLDEVVTPPQSLFGLTPAEPISRRAAIISSVAHASEHLGELMLTKDLLLARE